MYFYILEMAVKTTGFLCKQNQCFDGWVVEQFEII